MLYQGLFVEIEEHNGYCVVIQRDPPITKQDALDVQMNMLIHGKAKGMLPLYVEEIDGNLKFFYQFTVMKMFSQQLKRTQLSMSDCYRLLLEIVITLQNSTSFFLHPEKIILHPDCIFCDRDLHKIGLICVPLKDWTSGKHWSEGMKELFLSMLPQVNGVEGEGVQQILLVLQREGTLEELRLVLEEKLQHSQISTLEPEKEDFGSGLLLHPGEKEALGTEMQEQPTGPEVQFHVVHSESPTADELARQNVETTQAVTKDATSKSPYWLYIAIVLLLLIWSAMYIAPSEGILYLCIGLSLWVISFTILLKDRFRGEEKVAAEQERMESQSEENDQRFYETLTWEQLFEREPEQEKEGQDAYYKQLAEKTVMLNQTAATQEDRTVLLSEIEEGSFQQQPDKAEYYLEFTEGEHAEQVFLRSLPFIIGREAGKVHYHEQSAGVSKVHCEILKEGEQILIRDLGSSNGTLLNEKMLVPYKTYPLNEGDEITICSRRFHFHQTPVKMKKGFA